MFQLFKKRSFSQLIGDTFSFFKIEGKNYFKNYFIINGGLLLILVVALYFLIKFFFEGAFASTQLANNNYFGEAISTNVGLFIGITLILTLLIIIVSLINYTYPICYLSLLGEQKEINTNSLIKSILTKVKKSIVFFLFSLVVLFPILFILMGLTFLLIMIIIGIPLLLIIVPAISSWISLSYYHYLVSNDGYIDALKKGYELLRSNFWTIIGSTFVMYMIVQIVAGIVTMIPYMFMMFNFLVNPDGLKEDPDGALSTVTIIMTLVMVVSILANYTLQNLLLINQGLIYYSAKELEENVSVNREIDSIGQNEE